MKMDHMIDQDSDSLLGDPAESNQSSPFESGTWYQQRTTYGGICGPVPCDICSDFPAPSLAEKQTVPPGYSADQHLQFFFSPTSQQIPSPMCFGSSRQNRHGQLHFQFNNYGFADHSRGTSLYSRKRKSNLPTLQPCKQLVTDEQMAEHMSKLHINSKTQLIPIEPDSVKNKRLYMCEEMRKLQDPIMDLPPGFFKDQPCTALVLWQPPQNRIIPSINSCISTSFKDADKDKIEANKSKPSTSNLLDYECLDNKFDGSMELDS